MTISDGWMIFEFLLLFREMEGAASHVRDPILSFFFHCLFFFTCTYEIGMRIRYMQTRSFRFEHVYGFCGQVTVSAVGPCGPCLTVSAKCEISDK